MLPIGLVMVLPTGCCFTFGGTLLGAVRNQSIVPWTGDVDVVVKGEEYADIGKKLDSNGLLRRNGYSFFYDKKYPDIGRLWNQLPS